MAFTSLSFLFLFLPLLMVVYYWFSVRVKNYILSFFSLVFLWWAGPSYALVLIFSVLLNWSLGVFISRNRSGAAGKTLFIISIVSNLLMLIVFKYSGFLVENLNLILVPAGIVPLKVPEWLLPLGISFYTFRLLSYQIELYRGKVPLERKIIPLFLYAAFFTQLGAGPIVRYSAFYTQLKTRKHTISLVRNGLQRFLLGLSKKVLIANNLGLMADAVFGLSASDLTFTTSWLGIIAYTLQVYYDFSGYTDMAIGLSKMVGFNTPENFNFPYCARSVKDFWRRWHMTLTGWFRDFLFLPVAYYFSRKMPGTKYLNIKTDHLIYSISIFITWFLVGFWHGASWTFIAWGCTFGLFLIFEQIGLSRKLRKAGRVVQHIYTLSIVIVAWIFFRADSFQQGFSMLKGMIGLNGINSKNFEYYRYFTNSFLLVSAVGLAGAAGWLNRLRVAFWKKGIRSKMNVPMCQCAGVPIINRLSRHKLLFNLITSLLLLIGFVLAISEILRGGYSPFIYFKF